MTANIRTDEFRRRLKEYDDGGYRNGEDYLILDVRTDFEFEQGHMDGAMLMPHDEVGVRADEVAPFKDKDVFVICRSGNRSLFASRMLEARGFTRVYNIAGGYLDM